MDTTKIIKGVVNSGRYTVTAPIVKEDYGLYLQIEGVELPSTYEVDFSNSEHNGTSVTMIGNADGVLIPHQFIDTGKDIFAFLYHVGANYGRTVYKFRIPNKVRPDRTSEQPTPEEQSVIDQAISALNTAVAQTAQDVIDADASAQSASADADRAEQAKEDASTFAQRSANSAQASADYSSSAQASATASAQSASQSAQIKADVEDLVDDAQGYAQASAQSATASANSASQAQGYAQSASASAQSASGYASNAQTSANTAFNKASEASTSAQTASTKATESAQSASQALSYKTDAESAKTASQTAQGLAESAKDSAISAKNDAESARDDAESARDEAQQAVASISGALADKAPVITDTASGSIASFSDGADDLSLKSLIVDINPVQDLHGQENPYPAGSTANQLDLIAATCARCTLVDVYTGSVRVNITNAYFAAIVFQANAMPTAMMERILNGEPITFETDNNNGYSISIVVYGTRSNGSNYQEINGYNNFVTITPTLFTAVTSIEFRFQRTGTQHTDTTTVITGLRVSYGDTATTFQPYENLCPISGWTSVDVEQRGKNLFDGTFVNMAVAVTASGAILRENASYRGLYIRVKGGQTYTVSRTSIETNRFRIVATVDEPAPDVSVNELSNIVANDSKYSVTVTIPDGYNYIFVYLSNQSDTCTANNYQVQLGSTATPYSPYTGRSITIQLGQTVYGGKLDVLSGELVIDRAMLTVTECSSVFTASTGVLYASVSVATGATAKAEASLNKNISSVYKYRVNAPTDGGWFRVITNAIYIYDNRFTDKATADTILSTEQPVFVYELATPLTIQLTPNQVNSLLGVNNLWADSGDTDVVYRADTKLFIERLTAPDSADMIADANITSGQYFMVGNSLYKATANIANGAQIIVGTNCIRKSLSEALNEINA